MVEAGAEVVETDTFQASRLKLEEWGLGEHTLEINRKAAEIARTRRRRGPLRRRLDRPDRLPARLRRPDARADPLRASSSRSSTSRPRGLVEGGADLIIIETAQDILEVKAAIFGAREAFKATGRAVPIQCSVIAAAQRRQDAARHRHRRRAHDARGAEGRRHRPQLLDRPRGHARRDPLPRRELAPCRSTASRTPACRCRAPTARRSSPRSPSRSPRRSASSSSATASAIVGGCCGTTPEHIRAIAERCRRPHARRRAPRPRPPQRLAR